MAKEDVSVYNTYILITRRIIYPGITLVVALLYIFVWINPASAQTNLQSGSAGLQPQSGQAQNSLNTQSETGSVQTSGGSSILSQNSSRPLGVVSSPGQITPDAVVSPSPTLKADVSPTPGDSSSAKWLWLAAGLFIVAGIGTYRLLLKPAVKVQEKSKLVIAPQHAVKPEPIKPKSKAAKKRKAGKAGKPKKKKKR